MKPKTDHRKYHSHLEPQMIQNCHETDENVNVGTLMNESDIENQHNGNH